jgi:hypothetical protein
VLGERFAPYGGDDVLCDEFPLDFSKESCRWIEWEKAVAEFVWGVFEERGGE